MVRYSTQPIFSVHGTYLEGHTSDTAAYNVAAIAWAGELYFLPIRPPID